MLPAGGIFCLLKVAIVFRLAVIQRLFLQSVNHIQLDLNDRDRGLIFLGVPILLQQQQTAIVVFCAFHALAQLVNFIRPQGKIDFANSIRFRLLFGLLWDFLFFLIEQRHS